MIEIVRIAQDWCSSVLLQMHVVIDFELFAGPSVHLKFLTRLILETCLPLYCHETCMTMA